MPWDGSRSPPVVNPQKKAMKHSQIDGWSQDKEREVEIYENRRSGKCFIFKDSQSDNWLILSFQEMS
jgi:hypothetical protein